MLVAVDHLATIKAIGLVGGLGGVLEFQDSDFAGRLLAPLWLLGLWLVFATTLGSSLSRLSSRPRLATVLGTNFGPVNYYAAFNPGAL